MIALHLDEAYFQWLYSQVGSVNTQHTSKTHWDLLRQLFQKEFVWLIPNDDNRVEDGRNLRYEFIDDLRLENVDQEWLGLGCSFLEMLIGLSRRLAFEAGGEPREWFWHFLRVLDIDIYTDNIQRPIKTIEEVLDTVIWRTYKRNGLGGLFPLDRPHEDQREVELWYQMSAYLLEL